MEKVYKLTAEGKEFELPRGAAFLQAASIARAGTQRPVLGAVMAGKVWQLTERIPSSGTVEFLDMASSEGARIYARSATFLLVRAARELFEGARVLVDYSINQSLYCEVHGRRRITAADVRALQARMRAIVECDEPFEPVSMPAAEAAKELEAAGRPDAAALLSYGAVFTGYRFGTALDTYYGPLVPSAGYMKQFKLQCYLPGFLLMIPGSLSPDAIPPFFEMPRLSAVFIETGEWGRTIGISRLSELNATLRAGRGRELVRMCEAQHERKLARIADMISREQRRAVLIAGPSSSGKTTFAHRLTVHLHTCGLEPLALSLDDYYLDRDCCPRDESGKFDLESITALDVPLFEEQLSALLSGEEVDLAKFNFTTGKSGRVGKPVAVGAGQPVIIEGINGLNDKLTGFIPSAMKFRIFVSALTQLNVDDHNRVASTDMRLLRRIVRDSLFRNHSADRTIENWPDVHSAEFRNIFPYQENADVIFNSALLYEVAALKGRLTALLSAIPLEHSSRKEADRLLSLLALVEPLGCEDEIPPISILREFIGGCTFYL
jgi:uridine kinase